MLACFASAQLTDDIFKASHFEVEAGLQPNIQTAVVAFQIISYIEVVTKALSIERKELELKRGHVTNNLAKNVQARSSHKPWKKPKHENIPAPPSFLPPP